MNVIGYLRVSTEEQSRSGLGLAAQRQAIAAAARPDWDLTYVTDDGYTAANLDRPGMAQALTDLARGAADALVVSKLDRLSRSVLDFATLMDTSKRKGWALVCLDVGVDTTTPQGQFVANLFAAFAEMERELIRQRTRDALQAKKANGARLGRPVSLPPAVRRRIVKLRAEGNSLPAICRYLNERNVPTAQGGKRWYPSVVSNVLRSVQLDEAAKAARRRSA